MTALRPLIPAVLAAALLAPAAEAQSPTLQWDRPCYTDDQPLSFTGAGFTPGGDVNLAFAHLGAPFGSYPTKADAAGALADYVMSTSDQMLESDHERQEVVATATDGTVPERSASSKFTFTRWEGFSPGRYVPGRKVRVEAFGWAFATGQRLYFVFQRRGRTVASVAAGRLSAPCGDRVARIRVPRKLKSGRYRLVLATTRRPTDADLYTWRNGRVVRRASASAAATRAPMLRSPHGGGGRGRS
jgi:hypothetical protein